MGNFCRTLLASACAGMVGCASLSGLSGGGDGSCGAACEDPKAKQPDAFAGTDAGHVRDAGVDAARTDDAGRDVATSHDVGSPHDSAVEAPACVPVMTFDAGLPGSCPTPDAGDGGTCSPGAVTPSQIPWVPPGPVQHVCTASQVASLFSSGAIDPVCFDCLVTDAVQGASRYGAIIEIPQITTSSYGVVNLGGCIAALEPCNLACAEAAQAAVLCGVQSCLNTCTLGPNGNAAYFGCEPSGGASCSCANVSAVAQKCVDEIAARGSPAAACLGPPNGGGQAGYEAQVKAIGAILCGKPGDGGS